MGEDVIADYLLFSLNRLRRFGYEFEFLKCCLYIMPVVFFTVWVFVCRYVEKYDLQEPSDDIQHVLKRIAVKLRKTQRVKAITGVGEEEQVLHFNAAHPVVIKYIFTCGSCLLLC